MKTQIGTDSLTPDERHTVELLRTVDSVPGRGVIIEIFDRIAPKPRDATIYELEEIVRDACYPADEEVASAITDLVELARANANKP